MPAMLALTSIKMDGGTQPRATTLFDVVEEYAVAMAQGAEFPPVVAFFDGTIHWLADGFHRTRAAEAAGLKEILADVRQGTQRDAILFSVGANAVHGMRRTNDDKRRAVLKLLDDAEWSKWSDSEIARRCAVDHKTVARLRPPPPVQPYLGTSQVSQRTFTHPKTGAPTQMRTGNIGGGSRAPSPPPAPRAPLVSSFTPEPQADPEPVEPPRPMPQPAHTANPEGTRLYNRLADIRTAAETLLDINPADVAAQIPHTLEHDIGERWPQDVADWFEGFAKAWAELASERRTRMAQAADWRRENMNAAE